MRPRNARGRGSATRQLCPSGAPELVEQRLCVFEIGGVEAFGKPAVDRGEQLACFMVATLVAAEPGEAHGGAQFPELGLLLPGDAQGFAIQLLGDIGMTLPQQQLALVSIQLGCEPALPRPFDNMQGIVEEGRGLFNLPCNLACPGQEGDMMGHPRLRSGGAVSCRTDPQQRYSLRHITTFDSDPSAIDGSL